MIKDFRNAIIAKSKLKNKVNKAKKPIDIINFKF